jgi:hypothetical protein
MSTITFQSFINKWSISAEAENDFLVDLTDLIASMTHLEPQTPEVEDFGLFDLFDSAPEVEEQAPCPVCEARKAEPETPAPETPAPKAEKPKKVAAEVGGYSSADFVGGESKAGRAWAIFCENPGLVLGERGTYTKGSLYGVKEVRAALKLAAPEEVAPAAPAPAEAEPTTGGAYSDKLFCSPTALREYKAAVKAHGPLTLTEGKYKRGVFGVKEVRAAVALAAPAPEPVVPEAETTETKADGTVYEDKLFCSPTALREYKAAVAEHGALLLRKGKYKRGVFGVKEVRGAIKARTAAPQEPVLGTPVALKKSARLTNVLKQTSIDMATRTTVPQ